MDKKILVGGALAAILSVGALGGGAAIASAGSGGGFGGGNDVGDGSIQAPDRDYENDAREGMNLKQLAELNISDAEQAALNSQPGEVTKVEIEDEEGYVVYEVELAANDGTEHEIKVDAGNGDILASETEDEDDDDSNENDETDDRDDLDDEDDEDDDE